MRPALILPVEKLARKRMNQTSDQENPNLGLDTKDSSADKLRRSKKIGNLTFNRDSGVIEPLTMLKIAKAIDASRDN